MKILEDPPLEVYSNLPWFVEALIYPAGRDGLIQIGIFVFCALLIYLFGWFLSSFLGPYVGAIVLVLQFLLLGYVLFYFVYCVYDSSKGGRRAPAVAMDHASDVSDFLAQMFLLLACFAICYWPAAVYYCFRRSDYIFRLLVAGGSFFLPMALLAGILFDATHALDPFFIVVSILRSFFAYCGLILTLGIFGLFVAGILWLFNHVLMLGFISNVVNLYLLLVAAYFLGRFYWYNKYKLDWGL